MDDDEQAPRWYVMRDLKRPNAKSPAYKSLPEQGFDTFTPMRSVLRLAPNGAKLRQSVPCVHGLLFVRARRQDLDPVVEKTDTLQYRFVKGARNKPMTVPAPEMDRFMRAVAADPAPAYYAPDELTADMIGREVIVSGGPLDGYRGTLLKMRGTRKRRLLIHLKGLIAAAIEVAPEYLLLAP